MFGSKELIGFNIIMDLLQEWFGYISSVCLYLQKTESIESDHFQAVAGSTSIGNVETVPFLNEKLGQKIMVQKHSRKPCSLLFSGPLCRRQTTLFAVTFVAVCFGICAALVHSHKVGEFAVTIRRCLIDKL